ncbi:MAG: AbrB/MazE/SpoVT family DNA-binding domain-containing protein [Dehalococcoidia bacterium]
MTAKRMIDVILRPKRQVTLPREICDQLGIGPGDILELVVEGSALVAKPKKAASLEALREIREAFKRSGVTEEDFLETGRLMRQEIARERYAAKV